MAEVTEAEAAVTVPKTRIDCLPVGGRLQRFLDKWQDITTDKFVLQAIRGHKLELVGRPPLTLPHRLLRNKERLGRLHQKLLDMEIADLLKKKAIEPASRGPGFFSKIFLVPKKDGGSRPVFNLRPLNAFLSTKPFKMATLRMIAGSIRQGDWAVSMDIKDAYLHVPIHQRHRLFLKFCHRGKIFQFRVLPFGLSTAPRTFTLITRPIIANCRRQGIRLALYLDDGLVLAASKSKAEEAGAKVMDQLQKLGFVINWKKSSLKPVQKWQFLGLEWDAKQLSVGLPADKIEDIRMKARALGLAKQPTCRMIQRFLGSANFAAMAVPLGRLHLRAIQACLRKVYKSPRDLFSPCPLDDAARRSLHWWRWLKGTSRSLKIPIPTETVTTDASHWGWGAAWGHRRLGGPWSPEENNLHINVLEMLAVQKALKEWGQLWRDKVVSLQADNRTVVAYLKKEGGTRSLYLSRLTYEILMEAHQKGISLCPAYLPGAANLAADAFSRGKEETEWWLDPWMAQRLFQKWGAPEVDLFASQKTTQCARYFTLDQRDRKAAGIDAFRQPWARFRLTYAFPPPQLIPAVLAKLSQEKTRMILIAPWWEEASWFPELRSLMVDSPWKFNMNPCPVLEAMTGKCVPNPERLSLTAWIISGKRWKGKASRQNSQNSCLDPFGRHPKRPTFQHGEDGRHGAQRRM
jgi:hypothetical protein